MEQFCRESDNGEIMNEIAKAFQMVRHFVGRLASRIRAVNQLIEDAYRLENFLSNSHLRVEPVPTPRCVDVPAADLHTDIKGILRRLMRPKDTDYETLCDYLTAMDNACDLSGNILSRHAKGDKSLKPRVHSEVQMVDHFHTGGLRFRDNDPFIASSKPACLCCKLYMKYHPIDLIPPDSHNKVTRNWGPALLPDGVKHPGWIEHRNILILMIHDISHPVLQQIRTLSTSHTYQADSLTQITQSENDNFTYLGSDDSDVYENGLGDADCKMPSAVSECLVDSRSSCSFGS
jgi:hypothetical protein